MRASLPLRELRRRYGVPGARVPSRLLRELEGDARVGARALARELASRRARERRESQRLSRLFRLERELRDSGFRLLAGVDEVGMGPLAGPVVAAAVVLPPRFRPRGLDDSKRLPEGERTRLAEQIRGEALAVSIAWVEAAEIDRLNVYQAGLAAMRRAVGELSQPPDLAVVDGRAVPGLGCAQRRVVGGDARVGSVAAASVVAKVARDAHMRSLAERYPGYGFERHVGYATRDHLAALRELGPTPEHRRSFAPVREVLQA